MKQASAMRALPTVLTILFATTMAAAAPPMPVPFETLAEGLQSGILVPTQEVVRTGAAWRALWARHASGAGPAQAMPEVDFSRFMVVAVFSGRSSAAEHPRVIRITREPARLIVVVHAVRRRTTPQTGVAPFHLVRTAASDLPVAFVLEPTRWEPIDPPFEMHGP